MFNIQMKEKENTILTETGSSEPAEIFTTDIKEQINYKLMQMNWIKDKVENHQNQLLNDVVTNEINKSLQSEIRPILKYEV